MKKRLSLIIPAFNCAGYLDETLTSVLPQLPDDCELIAVDDGSADGTPEMLKQYAAEYGGLRIALRDHRGVSSARNTGLELAEGEWIAFMDCDDVLKAGFLEKALPLTDSSADLFVFSFERVELMEEGLVAPLMLADRTYHTASDFADEYVRTRHLLVYSACNKFYRKAILDEHAIRFREGLSFGEDRLFNYEYLKTCGSVITSSIRMFLYMQRSPDSASKRSFPNYFQTIMMLHDAKMDCFPEALRRDDARGEKGICRIRPFHGNEPHDRPLCGPSGRKRGESAANQPPPVRRSGRYGRALRLPDRAGQPQLRLPGGEGV